MQKRMLKKGAILFLILFLFAFFLVINQINSKPLPPTIVNFEASPDSINSGDSSSISWQIIDLADGECEKSGGTFTGTTYNSVGSQDVSPTTTTTYTLTCTNDGGTVSASRIVTVTAQQLTPQIKSFTTSPSAIISGQNGVLSWTSINTIGCEILNIPDNNLA